MLQSMKRNRTHLILTAFVCLLCLSVLDGCTKKDKKKSNAPLLFECIHKLDLMRVDIA